MRLNKTKFALIPLLLFLLIFPLSAQKKASDSEIESKINVLLSKMTLAEKLGQLQQLDGEFVYGKGRPEHFEMARKGLLGSTLNVRGVANTNELQKAAMESRLKIPILFGFDVIHGYRTIFPVPLGESASWDLAAMEKSAYIAAQETRAAGVHWTFAPMVDVARDPRWGRIVEGAGEDTFLGSQIAAARVHGFQGSDFSANDRVMACAKHFVGYGAIEGGRDYNTTDMSDQRLRNIYLPPFKAAVDAGVGSFMTSFNSLNGVPSTANPYLWKTILRGEWNSPAMVVTDYNAAKELINHGVAGDQADAARLTLNAGVDMEMVSQTINENAAQLLKEGKITMAEIDGAVRSVLRAKYKLGLFDKPFADENREKQVVFNPEYRQFAREDAAESFVLLKNDRETLPISKSTGEIAVIGSLANDKKNMNGNWIGDGRPEDPVTVLEGLKNKLGNSIKIRYEAGCDTKCTDTSGFDKAVEAAKASDFTILVIGEDGEMSAEAASRSNIDLPGRQLDLVKAIHATGKPYAIVLMNGRPLTIPWLAENSPAILETWFAGTEAGNAIADTLFGDANPGGKLPITFPRSVGQIPIYYNALPTGRPYLETEKYTSKYLDIPNTPLYPFGYGLSYTQFNISNLRLEKHQIKPTENVKVSVDVENTGKRDGAEVVQLYIHDLVASLSRPVKQLKGFQRVILKKGEKRTIEFTLTPRDLSFISSDAKVTLEDGDFKIFVGDDSNATLLDTLTVSGAAVVKKKLN